MLAVVLEGGTLTKRIRGNFRHFLSNFFVTRSSSSGSLVGEKTPTGKEQTAAHTNRRPLIFFFNHFL